MRTTKLRNLKLVDGDTPEEPWPEGVECWDPVTGRRDEYHLVKDGSCSFCGKEFKEVDDGRTR